MRLAVRWVVAGVLCLLGSHDARAQLRLGEFLESVQQRHLENGLTVVVQEDHRAPLVSLSIGYEGPEAGSPAGRVTKLLMTHGSTKHLAAGDYERLLARAGATGGKNTTWIGDTHFNVTLPANRLALALWLWSEQMGLFDDGLTDEQIALAKTKQREQERADLDGSPMARLDVFASDEMYPPGHPNRLWWVTPQSIDAVDRAAILTFHDKWIVPSRATLAIVGDVSAGDAFALVERYFGSLPSGASVRTPPPAAAPLTGETQIDVAAPVPASHLSIRWLTPRHLTTDDARLDIVAHLLTGSRTSWLAWSLIDEKKIATNVTTLQRSSGIASAFEIAVDAVPGRTAAELLAACDDALDQVRTRAVRQSAIDRAAYEFLVDPTQSIESAPFRADRYVRYAALVGTPDYMAHDFQRYRGVTPDDVRRTIERWLPHDRRLVLLVDPAPGAAAGGEKKGRRFVPAGAP
jgi:predicted Zn-dependent peptidase